MNEKHDALIKRIDAWFDFRKPKSATGDVINHDCPRDEFAAELLADCRAALSRKYTPMTEAEFDALSAQWPGEEEIKIYCWEKHIESEVIRRAGLEVSNDN